MKIILAAALMMSSPVAAQDASDIKILSGHCTTDSHLSRGPIGTDLSTPSHRTAYACNAAVVSIHKDRGSTMVQFATKKGDASDILGFAGPMTNDTIKVKRIYMDGEQHAANDGACKFFFAGTALKGIVCGGQVDTGAIRTVPIVVFEVS